MRRNTIFIGHANPEDNEFTLWLYYKLKNEGYSVECDLSYLIGGESDYWDKLQKILEGETCKYILVLSKTTFLKDGVLDEWEHCKSIAKKNNLKDFRIPVRLDEVDYSTRIGLNRINIIDFSPSWVDGLRRLLKKLNFDNVPRSPKAPLSLSVWFRNKFSIDTGLVKKYERIYSNWLKINRLPGKLYFYHFGSSDQAIVSLQENNLLPVIQLDRYLISFEKSLQISQLPQVMIPGLQQLEKFFFIDTEKGLQKYESDEFPKYKEMQNLIKRLLKEAIHLALTKKGLKSYILSGDRKCFYFEKDQLNNDKIFFDYQGKRTWKLMVGDYRGVKWHYGLSFKPTLYPFIGYILKSHILFSDDGKDIWTDPNKMHRYRRGKGSNMFNQHWRNQLLGFLNALADDSGKIVIDLSCESRLRLNPSTLMFSSAVSYNDPGDNARIVPLNAYDEFAEDDGETEDADNAAIEP